MTARNIIIAPCGNKSFLFKDAWLKDKDQKEFDVCLLFYHEQINDPSKYADAEYFYHLKDFKYHMLHNLLTQLHPEWLQKYDYFYFLDDDIDIDTQGINSMFTLSRTFKSSISQAALSQDSFCSWAMFKQQKNSFCRFVGQIEVMAPLFDAPSLRACLPSFIGNRSSWGVDSVWPAILKYPRDKLVVFDSVIMKHTLPVGGGELYVKIGVNPHDEWTSIAKQFNAKKHNYQEYGRLQMVNRQNNRLSFFRYKLSEAIAKIKQGWTDYDLMSRVVSQKNKFRKKISF
ncbi:MAG: DUF707 domain-containing protein [Chitinophagaceae bacterium]